MSNPFDYITAISSNKDIIRTSDNPELAEKQYPAFMTNRGLSYFPDTILHANEMNMMSHLDSLLQNDYLLNSIRPRKRFSKWAKKRENSDIEAIKEYYGFGYSKAVQACNVLSSQQINDIKKKLEKGGRK